MVFLSGFKPSPGNVQIFELKMRLGNFHTNLSASVSSFLIVSIFYCFSNLTITYDDIKRAYTGVEVSSALGKALISCSIQESFEATSFFVFLYAPIILILLLSYLPSYFSNYNLSNLIPLFLISEMVSTCFPPSLIMAFLLAFNRLKANFYFQHSDN